MQPNPASQDFRKKGGWCHPPHAEQNSRTPPSPSTAVIHHPPCYIAARMAVIVVSHDRQLLGTVVDQFWLVSHGTVSAYDDDLESYADWLLKERKKEASAPAEEMPKNSTRESKEKTEKLSKIEKKITELQKKIDALNMSLSDLTLYEQTTSVAWAKEQSEKDALEKQLMTYENQWYDLMSNQ